MTFDIAPTSVSNSWNTELLQLQLASKLCHHLKTGWKIKCLEWLFWDVLIWNTHTGWRKYKRQWDIFRTTAINKERKLCMSIKWSNEFTGVPLLRKRYIWFSMWLKIKKWNMPEIVYLQMNASESDYNLYLTSCMNVHMIVQAYVGNVSAYSYSPTIKLIFIWQERCLYFPIYRFSLSKILLYKKTCMYSYAYL